MGSLSEQDRQSAKQMLEVAKQLREKARVASKGGRDDLAEIYGKKAMTLEESVKSMVKMLQAGVG